MDIKDLASSLLSLSDLITISNRVLNGDKSPAITTKIIATNRGSFMVDLESIQQLAPMLGIGTGVVGAGVVGFVLRSIFGGVIGNASYQGLVHLRKRFLGKTPYEQIAQPDDTVKLLYHEKDGDKEKRAELAIPQSALQLSQSRQVIQSFDNMTKPLLKQGIDRMEFSSQDTQVGITKEEAVKFINDGTNVQSIDEQRVLCSPSPASYCPAERLFPARSVRSAGRALPVVRRDVNGVRASRPIPAALHTCRHGTRAALARAFIQAVFLHRRDAATLVLS